MLGMSKFVLEGKTQEEVSKTIGVTQKTVSEWEEKVRSNIPKYNVSTLS